MKHKQYSWRHFALVSISFILSFQSLNSLLDDSLSKYNVLRFPFNWRISAETSEGFLENISIKKSFVRQYQTISHQFPQFSFLIRLALLLFAEFVGFILFPIFIVIEHYIAFSSEMYSSILTFPNTKCF